MILPHGTKVIVFVLLFLACNGVVSMEPPDFPRARIILAGRWEAMPVQPLALGGSKPQPGREEAILLETAVELSEELANRDASLLLEGTWWKARIEVNGHRLPEVAGSPGGVEVPLGQLLRTGSNDLRLELYRAVDQDPLLTASCCFGGLSASTPVLLLRPETHVRDLALALSPRGDSVTVSVHLSGLESGSFLEVLAVLDGEVLASLGRVPVESDTVVFSSTSKALPGWRREGLFHVLALWTDRDGRLLDAYAQLTGLRSITMEEDGFVVDGKSWTGLAVRAQLNRSPSTQFRELLGAGIGALEVHGGIPSTSWLREADEMGLALVILPRCDGEAWSNVRSSMVMDKLGVLARHSSQLRQQDDQMIRSLYPHPSVLAWICEGEPAVAAQLCAGFREDPISRPVIAGEPGTRTLFGLDELRASPQRPSQLFWMTEITRAREEHSLGEVAEIFHEAVKAGRLGGVALPPPPDPEQEEEWRAAWARVARELGNCELHVSERRRASAEIQVQGAEAGALLWLEVPWQTPLGVVADQEGRANMSTYYQGPAVLRMGGRARSISLDEASWKDGIRQASPLVVRAGEAWNLR